MSNAAARPITDLIPHRDPMVLVDCVLEKGSDYLITRVDLARPNLFMEADGRIPAYVGIEYMAQSISAFIGATALENGQPVKLGFLLGSRKYAAKAAYFPKGESVTVTIKATLMDKEFGVFDCTILTAGNTEFATAQLKAVQPDDISLFLEET